MSEPTYLLLTTTSGQNSDCCLKNHNILNKRHIKGQILLKAVFRFNQGLKICTITSGKPGVFFNQSQCHVKNEHHFTADSHRNNTLHTSNSSRFCRRRLCFPTSEQVKLAVATSSQVTQTITVKAVVQSKQKQLQHVYLYWQLTLTKNNEGVPGGLPNSCQSGGG